MLDTISKIEKLAILLASFEFTVDFGFNKEVCFYTVQTTDDDELYITLNSEIGILPMCILKEKVTPDSYIIMDNTIRIGNKVVICIN